MWEWLGVLVAAFVIELLVVFYTVGVTRGQIWLALPATVFISALNSWVLISFVHDTQLFIPKMLGEALATAIGILLTTRKRGTVIQRVIMKYIKLIRHKDASGISGLGFVAEGVVFQNGWCVLYWFKHQSLGFYDSVAKLIEIHGHNGDTDVIVTSLRDAFDG